jgi:hypothetical protein
MCFPFMVYLISCIIPYTPLRGRVYIRVLLFSGGLGVYLCEAGIGSAEVLSGLQAAVVSVVGVICRYVIMCVCVCIYVCNMVIW